MSRVIRVALSGFRGGRPFAAQFFHAIAQRTGRKLQAFGGPLMVQLQASRTLVMCARATSSRLVAHVSGGSGNIMARSVVSDFYVAMGTSNAMLIEKRRSTAKTELCLDHNPRLQQFVPFTVQN
jgi:hypothetical protein